MDTGFAGYRHQLWTRWPTAGPTEIFGDGAAYHRSVEAVLATGTVLDEGMIYFDARLSAKLPTVEVRVADVCLRVADAVLLAGLVRGLVNTAAAAWQAGEAPDPLRLEVVRLAHWQAAKYGMGGDLLDPHTHRPRPAWDVLDYLFSYVHDALSATGDAELVKKLLHQVRRLGNGAHWQVTTAGAELDPARLVKAAAAVTTGTETALP
jgi:carboxylate-amine ligase